jgi:serine phosphatase RsbU (regulator of sigma subunit)
MALGVAHSAWLIPLPGGPPLDPLELKPSAGGIVIGRHEQCPVRLPPDADKVSRQHARFVHQGGQWRISDLQSRWGTFVNGVKIPPLKELPVDEGDLVRIVPWTFSFSTHGVPHRGLQAVDDTATNATMVRKVAEEKVTPLQDELLNLLLESASAIHAAQDEKTLATLLMDVACRGTGLPNAAVLRALDTAGRIEVLASRSGPSLHPEGSAAGALFSRSLLAAAAQGTVAEITGGGGTTTSQSIIQMKIDAAICVPLMLGSTVAAYLYLDSRGGGHAQLRTHASSFCVALSKIAGLALANLKRLDIERRTAYIEAELTAAVTAQRWILPRNLVKSAPFVCSGSSRPGQYLGGDFFDALILSDGRMVVTLGDVSGHGIAASVLMTASQGFLHAALADHGDPARAVRELNTYIHPRRPEGRFITLWVGLFDPGQMTLNYVDAGHGYALMIKRDNTLEPLSGGEGLPIGIMPDSAYSLSSIQLPPGGRVLIISDGLVEQFEPEPSSDGKRQQFEVSGVQAAIAATPHGQDPIARLFEAVYKFAKTQSLSDDATAVMVTW